MAILAAMLWRRLDTPGHDVCRLEQTIAGWSLEGIALFRHAAGPASIAYAVTSDRGWETVSGRVRGFIGDRQIEHVIARRGAVWSLNGRDVPGLEHLADLDLSFTPATNLLQLRRVALPHDDGVQLPAAWFDLDAGALTELRQIYRRRDEMTIWYEAPGVGYEGLLKLAPNGFIRRYPGLWEAEQVL